MSEGNPSFSFSNLQVDPLSTISAIRPNVIHGHQQVKQPETKLGTSYKSIINAHLNLVANTCSLNICHIIRAYFVKYGPYWFLNPVSRKLIGIYGTKTMAVLLYFFINKLWHPKFKFLLIEDPNQSRECHSYCAYDIHIENFVQKMMMQKFHL